MTLERPAKYLVSLVRELCKLTGESEWVEFKVNVREPEEVGEYISAVANSAASWQGVRLRGVGNFRPRPFGRRHQLRPERRKGGQ